VIEMVCCWRGEEKERGRGEGGSAVGNWARSGDGKGTVAVAAGPLRGVGTF